MTLTTLALRKQLEQTEADIDQTNRDLDLLDKKRTLILHQLAIVATFPVLTLPVEITREIFIGCLPFAQCRPFTTKEKNYGTAAATLLSICREWRHIALSTPELWTVLSLRFDPIPSGVTVPKSEQVEAYIDRWLGRAGMRPLSLCFERARRGNNVLHDCSFPPTRMGGIINRYSKRIEYLELYLTQTDIDQLGLDDIELPQLERVSFGPIYPAESDNPVVAFPHAPRLHNVSLVAYAYFEYYALPSLQLTTFEGTISSMELFSVALNLVEVKCSVEFLDPTPTSPVQHPRLQSLAFFPNVKAPMDILPYLTLPSLQALHISEVEDTTYPSLFAFFRRSGPPLTTLCIRANNEDFLDWEQCVSSVGATLENLELEYPSRAVQDSILCIDDDKYPYNRRVETSTIFPRLPN
ncbi:hypothetical protein C8F04DRAFT_1363969 [Mycena alexandri]|uniref:F-box domain-containing protein n=1 Tax=Mycena alexandri TaxID=1745969 RepID=A0AAD6RVA1_9AGAR|nr:hypothetical protein C8F04DRAFT_1363969 [Mycena alexandri]